MDEDDFEPDNQMDDLEDDEADASGGFHQELQ
jgi:hypothetical protein